MKPSDDELDLLLKRLHLASSRRIWRRLVERAEQEERAEHGVAGIVDEHAGGAELGTHPRDRRGHRRRVGDVRRHRQRAGDFAREAPERFGGACQHRHAMAAGGEAPRHGQAGSGSDAGHHTDGLAHLTTSRRATWPTMPSCHRPAAA